MVREELQALVTDRAGWTVTDRGAEYDPAPGGWRARVWAVARPGKSYLQLHVAVIDPGGTARHTHTASTPGHAVVLAERHVAAEQLG